jgi:type I restriction enzyme S subunit
MKPGYKQTEVGVIPEDWDVKAIEQIGFVTSGKRLPLGSSLVTKITPHPYIRVTDMRPGTVELSEIKYVPENVFPAIKRYRIYCEDIFISVAGSLGIVGKVPQELNGANLTENADRITNITCSQDFLLHVLMSPLIQNTIESLQTVGAQPKLALTRIRKFAIPHPPLPEQRAIATALSDMDGLLGALERLIAKKRDLKQAAMQQLLTGQTRLPGFSGDWVERKLGEVADMGSGGTPPSSIAAYYDGEIPWVSISDMTKGGKVIMSTDRNLTREGFSNSAAQMFPVGTVLYAMYASLGECSVAGISLCSSQAILGIRPKDRLSGEFLYYFLTSLKPMVKTLGQQGTQANLNKRMVQDFRLSLPPIAEQTAIAAVLSEQDGELTVLEQRREKTRALKQAMMQELLTGRTRLV